MNAQNFINKNVQSGKDIVFAEDHLVTTNTFDLMNQTILDNPGKISAVSLEIPAELQPFLDKAAAGNINAETFVKQVRITTEQSHLDAARNLLNHEEITQKDYDQYEQRINQRVEDIINGSGDEYPLEQKIEDEKMFGSMYHLTQTAEKNGVKVIANDLDREIVPLLELNKIGLEHLLKRFDDNTDHALLAEKIDLSTARPILVHRGAAHVWDIGGYSDGLDDTLEKAGRDVVTIGNYSNLPNIQNVFNALQGSDLSIKDATDATIINGKLIKQPDLNLIQTPTPP